MEKRSKAVSLLPTGSVGHDSNYRRMPAYRGEGKDNILTKTLFNYMMNVEL
ncbi:hypothetical protein SYJ56_18550 [Algoriphagus sp. D3-2-R+10]|uniref:hypothetical protein n=1 Tax=Algoriphagus aurantiacus TaxID=3103948 RepID=UPI002B3B58A6|nr:hypothetical protein [Algoriphagus sp. D3-2-R+10]MEB2777321.1 hypothetical protein [Algoriphagus sp. D3-2-R+10]